MSLNILCKVHPTQQPLSQLSSGPKDTQFEKFLVSEYEHVADAYFNTTGLISSFFRYYLLIVTLPVPLIAIMVDFSDVSDSHFAISTWSLFLTAGAIVIAFVGMFVMCYLINQRLEGLLYVRQVNGIRNYFHSTYRMAKELSKSVSVLPLNIRVPDYYNHNRNFLFVVAPIFLLNSFYFGIGAFSISRIYFPDDVNNTIVFIVAFTLFAIGSWVVYFRLTRMADKEFDEMIKTFL